jgi:hypothetical protein
VTAEALARFAASPGGLNYARVCDAWRLDPGAGIEDDVLAYNLRAALIGVLNANAPKPDAPDPFEQTRKMGQAMREGRWPTA